LDSKREIAAFRYGNVEVINKIEDFFDYTKALFKTALNAQKMGHLHSDDWHRTIYIDTLGIGATDFNIDQAKKERLLKSGEDHTRSYFKWFETAKGKNKPINRI
jgi:NTE family protein